MKEKISDYFVNILSEVFDFGDMDYSIKIKMFNAVMNKIDVDMVQWERYELFKKIYNEGIRDKEQEYSRGAR